MFGPKLLVFALFYISVNVEAEKNNVCTKWLDYGNMDHSPNCYYDPDVFAETPELLERHIGEGNYENHTVTTKDGYILTMFRLVKKAPKGVIMLQHPIFGDGIAFVAQGNESLAFTLWNMGYEIWLPNHRGTYYSDQHTSLNVHDLKYWDFGMEEIGLIDYPLFAETISKVSKTNKIIFIGHSMACTSSLIYGSVMPNHVQKYFKIFIEMEAPVYFKNVRTIGRFITPLEPILRTALKPLGIGGIAYRNSLISKFKDFAFKLSLRVPILGKIIAFLIDFVIGWTFDEFDPKMYSLVISKFPRGAAANVVWQYLQLVNNGGTHFRRFDYGAKENLIRYKSITPPEYPIQNMTIPTFFIHSTDDYLADYRDNDLLWSRLPNETKIYGRKIIKGLNHSDFFWGKHVYEYAYQYLFELLKKLSGE